MIGKTISHYKILEKLGGGGMAIVYKALDLKLDRFVALKFLPQHLTTSEEEKHRFIHEAKAASSLDHSNICNIYEIDENEDGQLFIAMAYYDGETLTEKVKNGPLSVCDAIETAIQIGQGLQHAHEEDIIHRDIKSANIIITNRGEVKIVDFGIAKAAGRTQLTKEGAKLGTVAYMSPEQVGGRETDRRTDIWSLGVVIYEMITGQIPFDGEYDQSVMYAICTKSPQPVTGLRKGVSVELERIIDKCLKKSPADRYQHIDELIVDLKGLKGESTGTTYLEKGQKKRSIYLLLPTAFLLIIVLVMAGYFFSKPGETNGSTWENSIAVLPFTDLSPEKDQDYFCDGIIEQILTNLANQKKLKVIARSSVMRYKDTDKSISQIGEELNVANILAGSASKIGNRVRINTSLVKSEDGAQIWAKNYDYDYQIDSVYAIYDDISVRISAILLSKLSAQEIEEIKSRRPLNTEAYEYYMKGTYFHLNKFLWATRSMEDFYTSERMLKKAIALDPNYVLSYTSLTDLYNSYYNLNAKDEVEKKKFLDLQETYIEKAYKLDQNSAEVNMVMGFVQEAKGEPEKAYEFHKKAFLLRQDSWIYNSLADFYRKRGLHQLVNKYFTKAIELNPLYPAFYFRRALSFLRLGEIEKAETDLQEALEINPDHRGALQSYGMLLIILKKYNKAEKIISRLKQIFPEWNGTQRLGALLLAAKGEREKALEIMQDGEDKSNIYCILKMKEEVIQELNEGFESNKQHQYSRYLVLKNHPLYDFLRSDPRFQEILAKQKKIYEENVEKYGDIDS